jgi:lipopolysaccharide biosynthesis glycosyltransferase
MELFCKKEFWTDSMEHRLMLYPSSWDPNEINEYSPSQDLTHIARLLQSASRDYYVKLQPIDVLHQNGTTQETWADSYTKLLAFNLTSFDRVLALDSDSIVLQNLDELFLLPSAPVAMPYVYWGSPTGWLFSSQMMLITPSATAFSQISSAIKGAKADEYDMDILNTLFRNRILRIPQRPYNLLSGEFRRTNHKQYLGPASQRAYAKPWDPDAILAEARFLHFSDWPVPKPWMRASQEVLNKYMPKCRKSEWFGASNCRDRAVWLKLYVDFAVRRKTVCGVGFELQSQVLPPDSVYRHGRWFHPDEVG